MNTYTLEQVLFAIRLEQRKLQNELDQLNKYLIQRSGEKAYFVMGFMAPNYPVMVLRVDKTILDYGDEYLYAYAENPYWIHRYNVTDGVPEGFFSLGKYYLCFPKDKEIINSSIKRIMETYGKKFQYIAVKCGDDYLRNVHLSSNYITMENKGKFKNDTIINTLDYNPSNDVIDILTYNKVLITPDEIYKMFNMKVAADEMPECYKKMIASYDSKPIKFEDSFVSDAQLTITEEPEQYVLKLVKSN